MKRLDIYPDYYGRFRCIAADCEDSCCAQWQIVVDDETALLYEDVPGEIGEKIQSVQEFDEDGDRVFKLNDGRCPFWEETGLCEIHRCLGEEYLCGTCSEYPRAVQDYGDFAEHDLSLSCPEASRLILSGDCSENDFIESYEDIPDEEICYKQEIMDLLKESRQQLRKIIMDNSITPSEALYECYHYAYDVQRAVDNEKYVCPEFIEKGMDSVPQISYTRFINGFLQQEILTDQWREILIEARSLGEMSICSAGYDDIVNALSSFDRGYRRMMLHYVDRYWLRAAFDCDVVGKLRLMAAAYIMLRRLQTAYYIKNKELPVSASERMVQLFSKEVEHNSSMNFEF